MNTFQFPCKTCGNMIEAEHLHCGKLAECPFCGIQLIIPTPGSKGVWGYLTAPENRKKLNRRFGLTAGILALICAGLLFVPPLEKKKPIAAKKAAVPAVSPTVPRRRTASRPAASVQQSRPFRPAPRPPAITPWEQRRLTSLAQQLARMQAAYRKAKTLAEKDPADYEWQTFTDRWFERISYMKERNMKIRSVFATRFNVSQSLRLRAICQNSKDLAGEKELPFLLKNRETDPNILIYPAAADKETPLGVLLLHQRNKKLLELLLARFPDPFLPEKYHRISRKEFILYGPAPEMAQTLLADQILTRRGKIDPEILETLLFDGAVPTGDMLSETVKRQDTELLFLLLRSGVDPNTMNRRGETALFDAVRIGNAEIEKQLRKFGADPRIRSKAGRTPDSYRHIGSFIRNWHQGLWRAVEQSIRSRRISVHLRLPSGRALLTDAVLRENSAIVRLLLENGARVNAGSRTPHTPLQIAADKMKQTRNYRQNLEIISLLISAGADCSLSALKDRRLDNSVLCDVFKQLPFNTTRQVTLFCEMLQYAHGMTPPQWEALLKELQAKKRLPVRVSREIIRRVPPYLARSYQKNLRTPNRESRF